MKKIFFAACFCILMNFFLGNARAGGNIIELQNLDIKSNSNLKSLRDDVKKAIFTIKSRRSDNELPELRFYSYTVKNGENFWVVLSKCSMDMDTLMSINGLTSPFQVTPGTKIYIPNMRGVVLSGQKKKEIYDILASENIDIRYVRKVNNSNSLDKDFIFVPCGKTSAIEKSLFLGTAFLSPLKEGKTTSGFGTRRDPFNSKRMEFHKGIDIGCPTGTRIFASRSGTVVFSGYEEGYGNLVVIEHEFGYQSFYGHLSKCLVKRGDRVNAGGLIAISGNTGRSTGPHLHFEIRKNGKSMNPLSFIRGF